MPVEMVAQGLLINQRFATQRAVIGTGGFPAAGVGGQNVLNKATGSPSYPDTSTTLATRNLCPRGSILRAEA